MVHTRVPRKVSLGYQRASGLVLHRHLQYLGGCSVPEHSPKPPTSLRHHWDLPDTTKHQKILPYQRRRRRAFTDALPFHRQAALTGQPIATEHQKTSPKYRNLADVSLQPMVPSFRGWPIMRNDERRWYMVGSASVSWGGPGRCSVTIGWPGETEHDNRRTMLQDRRHCKTAGGDEYVEKLD